MTEMPDWSDWADNAKKCYDVGIEVLRERLEKSRVVIGDCTLYNEDCRFILPTLSGVDAVVTDPPYGIGKADWDIEFPLEWFDLAAPVAPVIAIMPGTWNIGRCPQERAGLTYKWTLSAHLINGMTKGGFGWGNWIPCVVYTRPVVRPQPEYVQVWCRSFAEWCKDRGIGRRRLDEICGTSDMGGWYLGLIPHRCTVPAPHQWAKIVEAISPPERLKPEWQKRESDYMPATDCKRFAVGLEAKPDHPSPKPLNVTKWFVETVSDGNVILDPFMGSGTTGVACVKLGRKFIGIEIDKGYFDAACRRIEEAYKQPDLFVSSPEVKPEQMTLV